MALVVALALAAAAVAQDPSQGFHVDLGGSATAAFDNGAVTRCFGSSHAATAMRADWQRELTQVQHDLAPEFVRFHGLLDDDMSVVIPGHRRKKAAANRHQHPSGSEAPAPQKCTFVADQDFHDMGANVVNASSKEECCRLCYTQPTGLPEPCAAAVYTQSGQCYFKIGDDKPYSKPGSGVWACVTDRPSAKSYTYSWTNIFTVFDFLRSINMRPIVEVSFMPELLAANVTMTNTVFHYKGILSPPKNGKDWRDFMTAFGTAMIDRYGAAEVRQWYFEVWNEPNCCGGYPDTGCCGPGCGNTSMYVDLFANTFKGLKAADPGLRVGGPATAQLAWLDVFVEGAVKAGAPPDFVSSHLYPTDPWAHEDALPKGRDAFFNAIAEAAEITSASAKKHGITSHMPFVLTEFNCGLGMDCADSFYSASFIAHHALNSQAIVGQVPIQSYWTFSDIFEEGGQQPYEFTQAFGTRSFNGIPKPVYRSMQLVKRLGSKALPVVQTGCSTGFNCTANLTVTTTDNNRHEALLVNHAFGPTNMRLNPTLPPVAVTITFSNGGAMPDSVAVRRVDATHANALPAYAAAGEPDYPNATMVAALIKASELVVEQVVPTAAAGGAWSVMLQMPIFSVASLSF